MQEIRVDTIVAVHRLLRGILLAENMDEIAGPDDMKNHGYVLCFEIVRLQSVFCERRPGQVPARPASPE